MLDRNGTGGLTRDGGHDIASLLLMLRDDLLGIGDCPALISLQGIEGGEAFNTGEGDWGIAGATEYFNGANS